MPQGWEARGVRSAAARASPAAGLDPGGPGRQGGIERPGGRQAGGRPGRRAAATDRQPARRRARTDRRRPRRVHRLGHAKRRPAGRQRRAGAVAAGRQRVRRPRGAPGQARRNARRRRQYRGAFRHARRFADAYGQAHTWDSLGYIHHRAGHPDRAVECYRRAVELFDGLGNHGDGAPTLVRLGDSYAAAGDREAAEGVWRQALAIFTALDHPEAATVAARLSP